MLGRLKTALRGDGSARVTSPSPPQNRVSRPVSAPFQRPPGSQLIPLEAVSVGRVLGEGEFGVVRQATWTTETGEKLQVIIKSLHRDCVHSEIHDFLKGAGLLQELEHEHIVRLYGVINDTENENLMLVTDIAPYRSLLECLKDATMRPELPLPRLCDFGQQVCDAMAYLESKRIVHRDLAARNILLFTKTQVKVGDISLSQLVGAPADYYQSKHTICPKMPVAWCAPESINTLSFSAASDVWSFGVVLWELFTYGEQPWSGYTGEQIQTEVNSGQLLSQPDLCTPEYYDLMRECWAPEPDDRPSFASLLLRLPQLRPTQVKARKDCIQPEDGYVRYRAGDIIVVLEKTPSSNPTGLVWRGVLASGDCGLFDPTNVVTFIEPKISTVTALKTNSLVRKESGRKGRKIRADMIGKPQNDLRHTGHIGYDGAVFGDVSFIGDNYDKLPIKVDGGTSRGSSMTSINRASPDRNGVLSSHSDDSLSRRGQSWASPPTSPTGPINPYMMSRESLTSQSTFQSDGRHSPNYLDVEDDSLFADFKMPELGTSFDLGPSFMDEVLKALNEKEKQLSPDVLTPTENKNFMEDVEVRSYSSPVPRAEIKSSSSVSAPPLPAQPPRVEPPKEKKQAKVKPMSASDERMVDTALTRAKELTSHMIGDDRGTPQVSPQQEDSPFFDDDSGPGLISKLKNSIRRSSSPKSERKRTFSEKMEEMEQKADLETTPTPEAQQAYNALVGRGTTSNGHSSQYHMSSNNNAAISDVSDWRSYGTKTSTHREPDMVRDSCRESPPKIPIGNPPSSHNYGSSVNTLSNRPLISAPQLQSKSMGVSQPKPTSPPVPAPRPVKQDSFSKKSSELPVPRPRPEIQRVEPIIRHQIPESPDLPNKSEKRIEINPPQPALRQDSKEHDREQLKRTIEIVRVDNRVEDNNYLNDDSVVPNSLDRSSELSSQRSSLDRSDNTSDNAESERAEWESSSDSSKPDVRANTSFTERADSFNKKQSSLATSLFEEDLEPSPQEIMSKLREKRLNRHLDHQRALTTDGEGTRPRNAREPNIPGRTVDQDDSEEVDTNPLRMLRGGAIPIRTGRSVAGRRIAKR